MTGNESRVYYFVLYSKNHKPHQLKPYRKNPKELHGCMANCASENII